VTDGEREAKRRQIVAAAERVFNGQGFGRTRVADIALEAGVGKGTVYEYFASKDELFFAVFESLQQSVTERIEADLEEGGAIRERLTRLFATGAQVTREQAENQAVIMDFWAASRGQLIEDRFRDWCVQSYELYRRVVANILREGQEIGEVRGDVDVEALAVMIVAAFDGLGVQLYMDRELDVELASGELVRSLCDGICR
jgi:AcrR family transcriptional regulator